VVSAANPDLVSVSIGPPPTDATGVAPTALWLYAVRSPNESVVEAVHDRWDALTIAGAYRDQCSTSPDTCVVGVTVETASGLESGDSASVIDLVSVPPASAPPAELAAAITSRAENLGLTDVSVQMLSDDGPVAEVTAATSEPATFVPSFRQSAVFDGLGLAGGWIDVRDSTGNAILAEGLAFRINQGVYWADPAYAQSSVLAEGPPASS